MILDCLHSLLQIVVLQAQYNILKQLMHKIQYRSISVWYNLVIFLYDLLRICTLHVWSTLNELCSLFVYDLVEMFTLFVWIWQVRVRRLEATPGQSAAANTIPVWVSEPTTVIPYIS